MKRLAAGVVVALVSMRAFFAVFPTYLPSGPDVAPPVDTWQGLGGAGVELIDEDGRSVLRLTSAIPATASVEFPVASVAGADAIEVHAQCAAHGLRAGRYRYQVGRVILAFVDARGKPRWNWPHVAGTVSGTRTWTSIGRRFMVPSDAVSARVILANHGSAGILSVRDLSVVPVRVNPRAFLAFAAWGGVWTAGLWMAARCLRLGSRPGGRAVLVAALAVATGMLLPERAIASVGTALRQAAGRMQGPPNPPRAAGIQGTATGAAPAATAGSATASTPRVATVSERGSIPPIDIHKAGHLAVFAWLAFVAAGCFRIRLVRTTGSAAGIGGLALYAFAAEQLQWLTLTRSAKLSDITYNLIGIAAGLLLAEVWRAWRGRVAA